MPQPYAATEFSTGATVEHAFHRGEEWLARNPKIH
jgi:hypothetical protein